jgi:hypothetical protein
MEGNFVPYERPHPAFGGEGDVRFLKEFGGFLAEHGLDQVLGLRDLDQRDPKLNVEVTEGRANIMMPRGSVPESELIPAVWVFGVDDDDRCNCREYCYRDSNGKHTGEGNHGCG